MSILEPRPSATTPARNRPRGNLAALRVAVIVLFAILTLQLANMQLVKGDDYARRAEDNYIRVTNILPPRGLIYDSNGKQLAWNVPVYQATVTPELLPEDPEARYRIYLQLERLTGTPALEIQQAVTEAEQDNRAYLPIALMKYISKEQALQIEELTSDMPGVQLTVTPGREYIAGQGLAHILGFVGPQTAENVAFYREEGYYLNEPVGKGGVESRYEKDLRGVAGQSANEEDAYGRVINVLATRDPVAGNSLKLAIDADLQEYVLQLLEDTRQEAQVAAAVVMDARTGEVYALVSLPSYDNNLFSQPGQRIDEYNELLKDPRKPFLNWALSANAPGSTFKVLTAAAGLQEGSITPQTTRNIPSTILEIKGENGEIYPLVDWRAHGTINLYSAIAWSSNIYFYMTACGIPGEYRSLGKDAEQSAVILGDYARSFGFGATTGIDIDGEAPGIVPTPDWKRRVHAGEDFNPEDREWYYADTCFMGIGQGDVTATPLQIARMTAAVANGGTLVTPHVANAVIDQNGDVVREIAPESKTVPVDPQYLAVIREGMLQSVNGGAGALAATPVVSFAGKTGTAEFGGINPITGKRSQHAWFTGFAPFDNPEVVVTVFFDLGVGGEKAAPAARKILEYYWQNVRE
jgi:penicillin-binding protein 2